MSSKLFFVDQDNDCHWYLIESSKRKEWEKWKDIPDDNPESWDVPEFAKSINSPYQFDFYLPSL